MKDLMSRETREYNQTLQSLVKLFNLYPQANLKIVSGKFQRIPDLLLKEKFEKLFLIFLSFLVVVEKKNWPVCLNLPEDQIK